MNIRLLLATIFVFVASVSFAQRVPDWVTNKPTPTNDTYLYVVESAFGTTEIEARNQAIARVFQSTAMRIGQPINSEEINRAVQRGAAFDVISRQYNIPINKVCEYTENKSGVYSVYILCQVAKAGNTSVHFDEYNGCYKGSNQHYAADALVPVGFDVYRDGKSLSEMELRTLFANSKSYDLYDRAMKIRHSDFWNRSDFDWGDGIFVILVGGTGLGIAFTGFAYHSQVAAIIGCALIVVTVSPYIIRPIVLAHAKSNIRKAVNLYNNGIMYSQNGLELNYGFTGNGVYLSLNF